MNDLPSGDVNINWAGTGYLERHGKTEGPVSMVSLLIRKGRPRDQVNG